MGETPPVDEKVLKVIVGLALENELYSGRDNPRLRSLYSSPSEGRIQSYYRELANSRSSLDRETSFWLETALPKEKSTVSDTSRLVLRLQRVEAILYSLLMQSDSNVGSELNDWMNYVANAEESLVGSFWLDAKIFASRALESAERTVTKIGPTDIRRLRYELGILKTETQTLFEELKRLPLTIRVSAEGFDLVLGVQEMLIELLSLRERSQAEKGAMEGIHYSMQKLVTAQRYLLRGDAEVLKAKQEISFALEYLERDKKKIAKTETRMRLTKMVEKLRKLLADLH